MGAGIDLVSYPAYFHNRVRKHILWHEYPHHYMHLDSHCKHWFAALAHWSRILYKFSDYGEKDPWKCILGKTFHSEEKEFCLLDC